VPEAYSVRAMIEELRQEELAKRKAEERPAPKTTGIYVPPVEFHKF